MGDVADNIEFNGFNDDNKKKYKPVQTNSDENFAKGRNMICKHAKFSTAPTR